MFTKFIFRRYKLTFYLSSGQKVVIKCKDFDMTKLSGTKGNRELTIHGADKYAWSIDVSQIISFTAKKCL